MLQFVIDVYQIVSLQEFCFKADMLLSWLQTQEGKIANATPISLKKNEVERVRTLIIMSHVFTMISFDEVCVLEKQPIPTPSLLQQMSEVTSWKNDFAKRARDKEALLASMTALINDDGATEDIDDVKKKMEDVDSLWDVLEGSVTVRSETILRSVRFMRILLYSTL